MAQDSPPWATSDLGTAAYVQSVGGLKIRGVTQGENGNYVFSFDDPKERGPALQVEYINSPCRQFDAAVRSLKKLCHDQGQQRHGRRGRRGRVRQ